MRPGIPPRARNAGFSLIELLVSMVIGLIVTLAITSVLIRTEGSKRSTTSVNDLNQNGAYAAFVLDRAIRSAGSGFSQSWSSLYGCRLDVSQGATHVLPMPVAIPAASTFASVPQTVRLAPVIIGKGLADSGGQVRGDVLTVMSGTAGMGESPRPVQPGSVTATSLQLSNTLGYATDDLVLLSDAGVPGGCMLQQVGAHARTDTGPSLPLAGTYYASTGTYVTLSNFGASTIVAQLGNASNNPPLFQLYGVGANHTLFSYDLLQPTPPDVPVADGVVEMRALYRVDNSGTFDGSNLAWIDPVAGSGYEASVLTNGSVTSQTNLRRIVAIRLGFILRTSLQERPQDYQLPAGTTLTLFGDLGGALAQTRTLTGTDLNYRYRTVEETIPLRNVLLAPQS